jgi:hypothetical protein
LTIILTSVLLLTMFGLGGYWLGARQQQSSSSDLLTESKSGQLPTATPFQQLSPSPLVTINWETYRDPQGFFSIKYPSDPHIKAQYRKMSSARGVLTSVVIQRSFEPGSQLDSIGIFSLTIYVTKNENHSSIDEQRQAIVQGPCGYTLRPYRN